MKISETLTWQRCQVLMMKVTCGAKATVVLHLQVPLTIEIGQALEAESLLFNPNGTPRATFKVLIDEKLRDTPVKAEGLDAVAKLISGFTVHRTDDGMMVRFRARFDAYIPIVSEFVQDVLNDEFEIRLLPAVPDSRNTSEDHATPPVADARVQ